MIHISRGHDQHNFIYANVGFEQIKRVFHNCFARDHLPLLWHLATCACSTASGYDDGGGCHAVCGPVSMACSIKVVSVETARGKTNHLTAQKLGIVCFRPIIHHLNIVTPIPTA
jgi:hypothetical protein